MPDKRVRVRGFVIVPQVVVDDGIDLLDLELSPAQVFVKGSELGEWTEKTWPRLLADLQTKVDSGEIPTS